MSHNRVDNSQPSLDGQPSSHDSFTGHHDHVFVIRATTGDLEIYVAHTGQMVNRIPHFKEQYGHKFVSCIRQPIN